MASTSSHRFGGAEISGYACVQQGNSHTTNANTIHIETAYITSFEELNSPAISGSQKKKNLSRGFVVVDMKSRAQANIRGLAMEDSSR